MGKQKNIEFGRSKPADEFFKAFTKAADSRFWDNYSVKANDLVNGAIKAFHEGHPENFQALLKNFRAIKFRGTYNGYVTAYVARKLNTLLDNSSDKQADIESALAKASPADKQVILNVALNSAVWERYSNNDDKALALLACGADPNGKTNSKPGSILAGAVHYRSPDVVKALYERGANFETARVYIGDDEAAASRLKFYQQTLTGVTAGGQPAPDADKIARLERKIDILTAAVQELTEEIRGQKTSTPREKPPRQPYPSL